MHMHSFPFAFITHLFLPNPIIHTTHMLLKLVEITRIYIWTMVRSCNVTIQIEDRDPEVQKTDPQSKLINIFE